MLFYVILVLLIIMVKKYIAYKEVLYISPLRLIQYFSSIKNNTKIKIKINYADDYYSIAYTFFIIIITLFPTLFSNPLSKMMQQMMFEKRNDLIASDWINDTKYNSILKVICSQIDLTKNQISKYYKEENKKTFIWKKFLLGLELIKSLFASNNISNLENAEILTQQKINEYLAFNHI